MPATAGHDPGKILTDLALALGGDCLADVAVLRALPELAGPVTSDPVVSRLLAALAAQGPRSLRPSAKPGVAARERAWALAGEHAPGADGSLILVDIDATIVIAHSEKGKVAPHLEEDVWVPSPCRVRRSWRRGRRGAAGDPAAHWERRIEHRGRAH